MCVTLCVTFRGLCVTFPCVRHACALLCVMEISEAVSLVDRMLESDPLVGEEIERLRRSGVSEFEILRRVLVAVRRIEREVE